MGTLNFVVLIPFLAAMLIPLFYKKGTRLHIGLLPMIVAVSLFSYLLFYIPQIANGKTFLHTISWIPSYGINFTAYLDGLSLILALLITGIGTLVILYSIYYLSENEQLGHFYTYLMLFMGAMLGVVLSDNMMVLYVFWELTSISSFLLIAFWYQRKRSREGAQKSLLITVSGGFGMLIGFLMIYTMTGTLSVREVIQIMPEMTGHGLFVPAMLLVLFGAFTKSAQFPFHIWLPDAMEAPTPVSAYLHSATMVKAGIYLVARFTPVFGGEGIWFWIVTGVGLFTLFWGSFQAVRQTDLKALLAFSTISQLGMIMSMFGMGSVALHFGYSTESVFYSQATFAALFHLVNHSTFKGALFMAVGIVDHEVGTRDIRRLGGLATIMPITFTVSLIGSFSMAGLPPFNGFLSKEMFFQAAVDITELGVFHMDTIGNLIPIVAWVASIFTFVYSMIIVFQTFLGPYKEERLERPANEGPGGMLISPVILAGLVVLIFLMPNMLGNYIIRPAVESVFPTLVTEMNLGVEISAWHGLNTALWMTIGVIVLGILLYSFPRAWRWIYAIFPIGWSLNTLYNFTLEQSVKSSRKFTNSYMTGLLRHYLMYIYLFFILLVAGAFALTGSYDFTISGNAEISIFEWIIALTLIIAAISILFAKSRLTAILLNSVLGYGVALLFVIFRAPDLALTQMVIETVTTVLFLVAYYFLPEWKKENESRRINLSKLLISIGFGASFTAVALAVQNNRLFDRISTYFENSYELAGGRNIVNTILSDFRGFDTMLEVVVLLIAGIGVYSIIKLKAGNRGDKFENQ
ncbi:Na+/H+ antiporter subunit A [Oceanobacillus sp. AG]|uniref:Na+/H+ antiporter subunit A n=1 Tax=Oceanobacillus sp. AG TaxID=2681969 RepID=UPI0012EC0F48|nr:Na+/H+ antiporter subunit A [Oceanobacillus sp. AG]